MPLPQTPQSLDELLSGAKQSLANANALSASINRDAESMPVSSPDSTLDTVNDLAHGITHEPVATLKGFFSGATAPALDAVKGVGDAALGFGRMLTTPPEQQGAAFGESMGGRLAFHDAPSAADMVQGATGVDPRASYARMGGQALGALALARSFGVKGPELSAAGERPIAQVGYSRPVSPRDAWNAEPVETPTESPSPSLLRGEQGKLQFGRPDAAAEVANTETHNPTPTQGPSLATETPTDIAQAAPDETRPPSPLAQLFKPRVSAAEAAQNLRDTGSVLGEQGPIDRTSVYPEDEADAAHRQGFYLENRALENQWKGLVGEYREGQRVGYGGAPGSEEPSGSAQPIQADDRTGHFTLPKASAANESYYDTFRANRGIGPESAAPASGGGGESSQSPLGRFLRDNPTYAHPLESGELGTQPMNSGVPFLTDESGSLDLSALRKPVTWKDVLDNAHRAQVGNLVSGPATLGKIGVSNLSTLLQKAGINAARDRSMAPLTDLASALNPSDVASDFMAGLKDRSLSRPQSYSDAQPQNRFQQLTELLSRPIGALDYATRQVADRAGMTPDEQMQVIQQQEPSSASGKGLLAWQRKGPLVKNVFPVVKSAINRVEMGALEPAQAFERLRTGASDNVGEDVAKLAVPAAAGAVGYAASDKIKQLPGWLRPFAFAAGGGYGTIPMVAGAALGQLKNIGSDTTVSDARNAAQEVLREIPLGEGINPDPTSYANRVIPGPIRQANPDYWTGTKRVAHTIGQKIESEIPGLAQLLRVKRQPPPHAKMLRPRFD